MSDLAQRIRAARDKLGVSIEEAERSTKIRRRYIEAIEAGDFDRLPDGPPARGFIKNYAKYLGLDADQSLIDFEAEVGVPITQVNEVVPPPPSRQPAVSRYTQLIKLPQVRWKGDLPPDEQAELDMMADAGDRKPQDGDHQTGLGRLVFRRTQSPSVPNSFSLREPKVAHASDVRPFQTGRSPFSLRNLTASLGNEATVAPRRISPMSVNGTGGPSTFMLMAMAVGGLVLLVGLFVLVILPALTNGAQQAASPSSTETITVSILGASGTPSVTISQLLTDTVALAPAAATVTNTVADTTAVAANATPAAAAVAPGVPVAPISTTTQQTQTAGQAVQPLLVGGVQLTLDAHEHAWVRVRVDGNIAYEGIPPIGPNSTWHGQNTVGIETGNAGAFDVILNGTRIGPPGQRNVTLKVTWDASGKSTNS